MEVYTKGYYKYCIVPMCENNVVTAPDKIYFHMPKDANIRKKWCKAMRRGDVSCLSSLYCCEDHFNVQNDTKNYIKYKIMALEKKQKVSLLLKKGVVPHIFQCQEKDKLQPPLERGALKRKQEALVKEAQTPSALAEGAEAALTETAVLQANKHKIAITTTPQLPSGPHPHPEPLTETEKRKLCEIGEIFQIVNDPKKTEDPKDEYDIYGQYVASELRAVKNENAALQAKSFINNILIEMRMGKYNHGCDVGPTFKISQGGLNTLSGCDLTATAPSTITLPGNFNGTEESNMYIKSEFSD